MTTFINANGLGQGDLHAGKQVGQRWFGGDAGYEASNSGGGQNSNARSIRVSFYERSTSSIGGVDDLLVVHNMAHTIIDDAPLSGAAGRISWTEAA